MEVLYAQFRAHNLDHIRLNHTSSDVGPLGVSDEVMIQRLITVTYSEGY